MKKIIIVFIAVCFSCVGFCQTIVKNKIVVNNFVVGNSYTQQQIYSGLGQPTKISGPKDSDVYENSYAFYYGKDRFYLIGNEFYGFDLWTSAYLVNGLIRVGDNISKINMLGGIKKSYEDGGKHIDWRPSNEGLYGCTYLTFDYDENNIITYIGAFIHDL